MKKVLLFLCFPVVALADIKVIQIGKSGDKAAVRFTDDTLLHVGDRVYLQEGAGPCLTVVSKVKTPNAVLDTSDCEDGKTIKPGSVGRLVKTERAKRSTAEKNVDFLTPQALHLPAAGAALVELALVYANQSARIVLSSLGQEISISETKSTYSNLLLGYGVTRDLSVNLVTDYYFSTEDVTTGSPPLSSGSQTVKSSGLTDPLFTIFYRFMNTSVHDFELTPFIGYSPSLIAAESGTADADGNKGRGGGLTRLGVQGGKKFGAFTLGGIFRYSLYGDRELKNAETKQKSKTTGGDILSFTLVGEYFVSPVLLFGAEAGMSSTSATTSTNLTTNIKTELDAVTTTSLTGKMSLGLAEDIWISVGGGYSMVSDYKIKGTANYDIKDFSGYSVLARFSAEF